MNTASNNFFGKTLVRCTDQWGGYVSQEALATFLKKGKAVSEQNVKGILACNRRIKANQWVRLNDHDAKVFVEKYPQHYRFA